jgi:hypothetical protein
MLGTLAAALPPASESSVRTPTGYAWVGTTWYGVGLVGAPAIHYAHGHMGRGLSSLALRAIAPPFLGLLGGGGACLGQNTFRQGCADAGLAIGSILGLALAAGADAALLAWERPDKTLSNAGMGYGWQLLLADAAWVGLGVGFGSRAANSGDDELGLVLNTWAPLYGFGLLSGPVIHFAHGEVGRGFLSLALRGLVGPLGLVPGMAGYCTATGGVKGCATRGIEWGLLGGALVVSMLDAFVLARPIPQTSRASAWVPVLQARHDSAFIGAATQW